jgi:molybdopterin/thiamine biosynthesis adenylyltransferase
MLISDDWVLPEQGNTGRFGVWQKDSQRAFAGAPQTGCSAPPRQHDDRALSILGLSESAFALRGIWFRLHREPRPNPTLQALLAEIDAAACQQEGWAVQQLIGLYGPKVRKGKQDQAILALGYPDGNGTEQWLFVRARLSDGADSTRWSQVGFLRRTVVESFETAPLHRDALMRRTGHIAQHLAARQVLIFGQGAIGSSISLLLAKAGVPRLRLVDRDRMRPGNTVRHICGLHFAGYDKTRAVQVKVQFHAPDCEVVTETATWNPVDLARWIDEADVVVDATAHQSFSLLLNALCVRAHRTAVYVTAHRRATIGRIRIVRPGQDACLVCYEGGYLDNDAYPVIPPGDEGAFIERGCGDPTIEASAVDAEATANWAARLVLWLLQDKGSEINHCLVVNEPIMEAHADLSRVGVHMSQWAPLPGCEACDRERPG